MTLPNPDECDRLIKQSTAKHRFSTYCRYDPYHDDIPPALLNSGDIHRYAITTGMMCPYYYHELKSASYPICIGEQIFYWDELGASKHTLLEDAQLFDLHKNSIVFVETKETFRLPDYIAIRFNLKIDLVHKGVLLGTGPLVDPGYEGKLLIPLHNLTSNTYQLYCGQQFVWVEFTKTSGHSLWATPLSELEPEKWEDGRIYDGNMDYRPFPDRKKGLKSVQYLTNAYPSAIRSSIPEIFEETKSKANEARTISKNVMIGVVLLVITMLLLAYQIVDYTFQRQQSLQTEIGELRDRVENFESNTTMEKAE